MTLTQLHYIITIAQAGSMNDAAKILCVSQPNLSKSTQELEKEIGSRLFDRTNRGIIVTPEGKEFIAHAKRVVKAFRTMENRYIKNAG